MDVIDKNPIVINALSISDISSLKLGFNRRVHKDRINEYVSNIINNISKVDDIKEYNKIMKRLNEIMLTVNSISKESK